VSDIRVLGRRKGNRTFCGVLLFVFLAWVIEKENVDLIIALTVFRNVVVLLLSGLQLAMLVRAVLSWFPIEPNKFINFIYAITEPVIAPIRALFDKMGWFRGLPIDMSFMASYLLIALLLLIL
jgi:YggT family protein